jgi:hypothetical protein
VTAVRRFSAWLLLAAAAFLVAGCAATPAGKLGDANTVISTFTERTNDLCTGSRPLLGKDECLDRIRAAREAQKAVNAATDAAVKCTGEGVELSKCMTSQVAIIAMQKALAELDRYVYGRK